MNTWLDVPHIVEGYFSKIYDIHDYGTRTNDDKTHISYRGPLIWSMIIDDNINADLFHDVLYHHFS